MIRINKILGLAALVTGLAFAGCKEAEYSPITNSVFIDLAPSVVNVAMPKLSDDGADMSVVVRLAAVAESDVSATLKLDQSVLDAFNAANGTEYPGVPEEYITVSGKNVQADEDGKINVTIPAGKIATAVMIHVAKFEIPEEKAYFLPVLLTGSSGMGMSSRMTNLLFSITTPPPPPEPIVFPTSVPVMAGAKGESMGTHRDNNWNLLLDQFTIEMWCRMDNYSKNNRAIFDNAGDRSDPTGFTEFYTRFGDANSPYSYMQVKAWGGQVQGPAGLVGGLWYHWAIVWDGSVMTVYRNDEVYAQKEDLPDPPRADGKIQFQTLKMVSSGSTYFNTNVRVSHVRFWKTARTKEEIVANMSMAVYRGDKNLIAYWPMDKFKEDTFDVMEDITGNGNDMTVDANIFKSWDNNASFIVPKP